MNRRGGTAVSYKEDSDDDKTGSDDVTEVQWSEPTATASAANTETDNADTIEKVLQMRRGRKGGMVGFQGMLVVDFSFYFGIRA